MRGTRVLKPLTALLVAVIVAVSYPVLTVAQSNDQDTQARIRALQQQLDDLSKQLKSLQDAQSKTEQQVSTTTQQANETAKQASTTAKQVTATESRMQTFLKGFFGTLDVSLTIRPRVWRAWRLSPIALPRG